MTQGHLQVTLGRNDSTNKWGYAVTGAMCDIIDSGHVSMSYAEKDAARMATMLQFLTVKWNIDKFNALPQLERKTFQTWFRRRY